MAQMLNALTTLQKAADDASIFGVKALGQSLGKSSFAPFRFAGNVLSHVADNSHQSTPLGLLTKGLIYGTGATLLPVLGPVLPVLAAPLVSKAASEGVGALGKRKYTETDADALYDELKREQVLKATEALRAANAKRARTGVPPPQPSNRRSTVTIEELPDDFPIGATTTTRLRQPLAPRQPIPLLA